MPFVMSQGPAEMCVSVHSLESKASDHLFFFSLCGIHRPSAGYGTFSACSIFSDTVALSECDTTDSQEH